MAALHHLDDPGLDQLVGRQALDALAPIFDRALGDVAALGAQQVRDRLERRRLAGAVGTQEGDDAAFRYIERDALEDQDDVIVDDLDVVDAQERGEPS
jgi:hypothetical protein